MHSAPRKQLLRQRPRFLVDAIEQAALAGLREHLENREYFSRYAKADNDERRRLAANSGRCRAKLETGAAEVKRELDRIVHAIIKGHVEAETIKD